MGSYFDEFLMVEPKPMAVSAYHGAHHLTEVLGCMVSVGEGKSFPFQEFFVGLGVEFDFALSSSRLLLAKNKISEFRL